MTEDSFSDALEQKGVKYNAGNYADRIEIGNIHIAEYNLYKRLSSFWRLINSGASQRLTESPSANSIPASVKFSAKNSPNLFGFSFTFVVIFFFIINDSNKLY